MSKTRNHFRNLSRTVAFLQTPCTTTKPPDENRVREPTTKSARVGFLCRKASKEAKVQRELRANAEKRAPNHAAGGVGNGDHKGKKNQQFSWKLYQMLTYVMLKPRESRENVNFYDDVSVCKEKNNKECWETPAPKAATTRKSNELDTISDEHQLIRHFHTLFCSRTNDWWTHLHLLLSSQNEEFFRGVASQSDLFTFQVEIEEWF